MAGSHFRTATIDGGEAARVALQPQRTRIHPATPANQHDPYARRIVMTETAETPSAPRATDAGHTPMMQRYK